MAKCNMSEDQVLAAYDAFYEKYPSGEITQVLYNSPVNMENRQNLGRAKV